MNFNGQVPVKNPTTHSSHFGPGSQWGKPYYNLGQECHKSDVKGPDRRNPLSLTGTQHQQCRINERLNERTLRMFGDRPSARSCVVSHNKDGLVMDSTSHTIKIGSKHMQEPRPDHPHALYKSHSQPDLHPWATRRSCFKDQAPWMFNRPFTTTNEAIGNFYSSHLMSQPELHSRTNYDWTKTKRELG